MSSRGTRFWRNVTIIALVHIALLLALIRWSRLPKRAGGKNIVWMNSGAGESAEVTARDAATPNELSAAAPTPEAKSETPVPEEEKDEPILTSAKSEIQLPSPTPRETPTPAATPEPKVTLSVTPTPRPTPKHTPKPTPTHTPKKKVIAKATPKPKAKPKKKKEEEEEKEETAETRKKKEIAKTALAKNETRKNAEDESESSDKPVKRGTSAHGDKGKAGGNGEGSGSGGTSEYGWYANMLHDRFYSEWVQPLTSVPSGAKLSALVKIRIEQDGTVSDFKVVRPSGNVVVDESVEAIARHVTQVDPLPKGLGNGDHYDVNINFELNPDE